MGTCEGAHLLRILRGFGQTSLCLSLQNNTAGRGRSGASLPVGGSCSGQGCPFLLSIRAREQAGRGKRKKSGFSLPLVLHSPCSAFLRFGLPKNKLSREFGKYTLFCMEIVENGFEKTQVNDQHIHQISSQLVPWLSFLPLSHPSPTLRSLSIDLYHFCSSAAFCCFQDNI